MSIRTQKNVKLYTRHTKTDWNYTWFEVLAYAAVKRKGYVWKFYSESEEWIISNFICLMQFNLIPILGFLAESTFQREIKTDVSPTTTGIGGSVVGFSPAMQKHGKNARITKSSMPLPPNFMLHFFSNMTLKKLNLSSILNPKEKLLLKKKSVALEYRLCRELIMLSSVTQERSVLRSAKKTVSLLNPSLFITSFSLLPHAFDSFVEIPLRKRSCKGS